MRKIIDIREYQYDLPSDRIAIYPLPERDQSKLLVYQNGEINHSTFNKIDSFLPHPACIFFNDTKVIPARLFFLKETGAEIELFLLSPVNAELNHAMQARESSQWKCAIGNLKRWTTGISLKKELNRMILTATLLDREEGIVKFEWTPQEVIFGEVINSFGVTPLPPYIKRPAEQSDRDRYQTIYSQAEGAVAAPTAGLHFTDKIIRQIKESGAITDYVTLHVSAGTFQPVKVNNALDHAMHEERIIITKRNVENLLLENRKTIAVGTTSLRTLESIYWYGVKLRNDREAAFKIEKQDPYSSSAKLPSKKEALEAVLEIMSRKRIDSIFGETSIYIVPGYRFRVVDALITNFHQPGSTLMLLVAAFVGNDRKRIYQQALDNNYRFLSYGDSSLLIR
jgi:S-adenosylmethionine:tRNA ribosyltransferase-isomerase